MVLTMLIGELSVGTIEIIQTPLLIVITLVETVSLFKTDAILERDLSGATISMSKSFDGLMLHDIIDTSLSSRKLTILPRYVLIFLTVTKFKFSR